MGIISYTPKCCRDTRTRNSLFENKFVVGDLSPLTAENKFVVSDLSPLTALKCLLRTGELGIGKKAKGVKGAREIEERK
jgi:hypothetical protein